MASDNPPTHSGTERQRGNSFSFFHKLGEAELATTPPPRHYALSSTGIRRSSWIRLNHRNDRSNLMMTIEQERMNIYVSLIALLVHRFMSISTLECARVGLVGEMCLKSCSLIQMNNYPPYSTGQSTLLFFCSISNYRMNIRFGFCWPWTQELRHSLTRLVSQQSVRWLCLSKCAIFPPGKVLGIFGTSLQTLPWLGQHVTVACLQRFHGASSTKLTVFVIPSKNFSGTRPISQEGSEEYAFLCARISARYFKVNIQRGEGRWCWR